MSEEQTAIIIGAGPAGLTAAFELATRTDIKPVVVEQSSVPGGLSRTINYKGNLLDLGGHRFFSRSDQILDWWLNIMSVESLEENLQDLPNQLSSAIERSSKKLPADPDKVLLVRKRLSRIYSLGRFFHYPLKASVNDFMKLGAIRGLKVIGSYFRRFHLPINPENNLEDFLINRFGDELYKTFFKHHTEKVWGRSCKEIDSSWGAQRIKGLNIREEISRSFKSVLPISEVAPEKISIGDHFLYPKLGPGQMWQEVARLVVENGGEVHYDTMVKSLNLREEKVQSVLCQQGDKEISLNGNFFFSTMPVKELLSALGSSVPETVFETSQTLSYRDHILVAMVVDSMKVGEKSSGGGRIVPDTWIYIHDQNVQLGRIQIYNNWSPSLSVNKDKILLGLEYFCSENDQFWDLEDKQIQDLAAIEIDKIGLVDKGAIIESQVFRFRKTYPTQAGNYNEFNKIINYFNTIENLYPVGRNGMHRYSNQDIAMLSAIRAVDNIIENRIDKSNIWSDHNAPEYIEEIRTGNREQAKE